MAGWSGPDRGPPVPELQTGDQRAQGLPGSETVGGVVRAGEGSHQDLQESGQAGGRGQSSSQGQGPLLPQLLGGDPAQAQQSGDGGSAGQVEDCLFIKMNIYENKITNRILSLPSQCVVCTEQLCRKNINF